MCAPCQCMTRGWEGTTHTKGLDTGGCFREGHGNNERLQRIHCFPRGVIMHVADPHPWAPTVPKTLPCRLKAFSSQCRPVNKTHHGNWYLGFAMPDPPSEGPSWYMEQGCGSGLAIHSLGQQWQIQFFNYFIVQNMKNPHEDGQDSVYLTLKSCLKPRLETLCTRGLTTDLFTASGAAESWL